jgi:DNA-binding CsgD family transcriptional regulator
MLLGGSPIKGITSEDMRVSRTLETRHIMLEERPFPDYAEMKDCGLIPLEKQVIALAVAGYTSAESAEVIGISEPALKVRLTGICNKLNVSNQFELILFALHHHLVDTYETSPSAN